MIFKNSSLYNYYIVVTPFFYSKLFQVIPSMLTLKLMKPNGEMGDVLSLLKSAYTINKDSQKKSNENISLILLGLCQVCINSCKYFWQKTKLIYYYFLYWFYNTFFYASVANSILKEKQLNVGLIFSYILLWYQLKHVLVSVQASHYWARWWKNMLIFHAHTCASCWQNYFHFVMFRTGKWSASLMHMK